MVTNKKGKKGYFLDPNKRGEQNRKYVYAEEDYEVFDYSRGGLDHAEGQKNSRSIRTERELRREGVG